MITLPGSLNTEIKKLYGVNPLIVIEVDWANDTTGSVVTNRYSTQEFSNLTTYRYIKEYSDVEIVNHVQGLGQVNSITVTAIDDFGHFKGRMDSKNVYRIEQVARVYLGAATSATTISSLMLLYTGRMENVEWKELNKEVSFDIVSDPLDVVIGFTPNIEMIDPEDKLLQGWLNPKTWPRVYGTVKHFEAIPLTTINTQIEVQEVTTQRTDGEGTVFEDIVVNDDIEGFVELDTPGGYWIFAKDDILDTSGSFTSNDGDIVYQPTAITNRLWVPGAPVAVTRVGFNLIEFDTPPPIPLKGMMLDLLFNLAVVSVNLIVRVTDTGVVDGRFRARLNVFMFGVFTPLVVAAGKNLFSPTDIGKEYRIMPKDQEIFQSYIIDTKEDVTVDLVQTEDEDGLHLIPDTEYEVKTTTSDGRFWDAVEGFDEHPNVTYLQMTPTSFFDFFEDFVAGGGIKEGLLVDMTSTINTETAVLTDIINLAGENIDTSLISTNRLVGFVLEEEEDFLDIIADIAWQGAKALRHHDDKIQVIDLFALPSSSKTIKDDEAILNSLIYNFSPVEEIFTKFKISLQTNDFRDELIEFTEEKNTDKYKERVFETDFFIYENRDTAQEVITYWVDRLSEAYHQLEIRATIENLALEVWDTISIQLGNLKFQDPSETFLTNVISGSSSTWDGKGTIKEISLDWENLEVIISMRFAARISTI